jgi:tetratricopeptide (TPR) repeat protein
MTPIFSVELDEALKLLRTDPQRSLEICDRYLGMHPDDPSGLFSRFQAWCRLENSEKALEDINRVLELDPNSGGFSSRGQFFHSIGNYVRAIEDLTKARELDEHEWETSLDPCLRADSLARLGRLQEALADCELIPDDHWMPALDGLPAGNKQEFVEEIKRRALLSQHQKG